ncbi:MAG TPA: hypothetical protein PKN20_00140 [Verrucomicrobiota bacterium]|jgi:hypothetical protein|nr:hypothetical protein [Verrucomicrobiota bacterium]HOH39761.1 hypothetical protein [Verrucomicrobiota bacterium]
MNRNLRAGKSEDQAGGTRVFLLLTFSAAEGAGKPSTVFSNIFLREECAHGWLLAQACATAQALFLGPWLVAKKRLYNRCAREWSGGLTSAARSGKID